MTNKSSLLSVCHILLKLFAAFNNAKKQTVSQSTLAKTVKGYGMGDAAEGKNTAHGVK